MQMEFDALEFIHMPNARYLVPAVGLTYHNVEDANAVASRYDGKVVDTQAVDA